ncbi:MAG: 2-dehydropantoate 2-reductase N-terminal domain-containing protein, partial [Acetobacterium sp.]|nr:2-dehydropantoate 2-reductase N-terminal domain-containing protein [Acetobacterium sp.]
MKSHKKVAVIGAGSWGTALALLLARQGVAVSLWAHRQEHVDQLLSCRENRTYLPGFLFLEQITVTADLEEAVLGASIVLVVVPSHVFRSVFVRMKGFLTSDQAIVSATKGIENDTLMTMTQVMEDELPLGHYAVLSGPSFAREVAEEKPTAVTVA